MLSESSTGRLVPSKTGRLEMLHALVSWKAQGNRIIRQRLWWVRLEGRAFDCLEGHLHCSPSTRPSDGGGWVAPTKTLPDSSCSKRDRQKGVWMCRVNIWVSSASLMPWRQIMAPRVTRFRDSEPADWSRGKEVGSSYSMYIRSSAMTCPSPGFAAALLYLLSLWKSIR